MHVIDCAKEVEAIQPFGSERHLDLVQYIVMHRNTKATDAISTAKWFKANPQWTGSPRMPYHFVINAAGIIEQAVPLKHITPAARGMNMTGIHICCVGDFRKTAPTKEQIDSATKLAGLLMLALPKANVVRHSEKKGCPGILFPLTYVNTHARNIALLAANDLMREKGVVL